MSDEKTTIEQVSNHVEINTEYAKFVIRVSVHNKNEIEIMKISKSPVVSNRMIVFPDSANLIYLK